MRGLERCNSKWVNAGWVDNEVFKSITQLLSNPLMFGEQWLEEPDVFELEKEIARIKSRLAKLDLKIKNAYDLITTVKDPETEKKYKELLNYDIVERRKFKSKLILKKADLKDKSQSKELLKELRGFYKNRNFISLSEYWRPSVFDDKYESTFKGLLLNLPFKEKKRIVEAVIAPESGGKCYLRNKRHSDYWDPAEIQEEMKTELNKIKKNLKPKERLKEERQIFYKFEKWDRKNPLINEKSVVDLIFKIDLNKLKTIITGLSKKDFLNQFDPYGTPRWIHDAFGRRRFFR